MIAEKSLNCSLISLPQINTNLPTCGPLEGLALMYILREQGALVTTNVTLSNRQVQILQINTFQVKGYSLPDHWRRSAALDIMMFSLLIPVAGLPLGFLQKASAGLMLGFNYHICFT